MSSFTKTDPPPRTRPRRIDPRGEPDRRAMLAAGMIPPPPKLPSFEPPPEPKRSIFKLQMSGMRELAAFLTVLVSLGLGVWNRFDRAPDQKVDAQEDRIVAQRERIEGPASDGGLAERVTQLEREVWPMTRQRCAEQQWLAQVFDRLGAQRVLVLECPDAVTKVQFTPGPVRAGRALFTVDTAMPKPE